VTIAFVQKGANSQVGGSGSPTNTPTITGVTTGNWLVATGFAASSLTANFTPTTPLGWTVAAQAISVLNGAVSINVAIYYKKSTAGGSESCAFNWVASDAYSECSIAEFSAPGGLVLGPTARNSANAVTTFGAGPTSATSAATLVVTAGMMLDGSYNGTSMSVSSGYTTIYNDPNTSGVYIPGDCSYKLVAAGAQSATWSWTTASQGIGSLVTFTEGAAVVITPAQLALAVAGYAPTIAQPKIVTPAQKALAIAGFAPTLAQPKVVAPGVKALVLAGFAPTVYRGPPLLLDLYPGAASAYSSRLLRSGYTGYCLRVRRSSDNATLDVGFTGSPAALDTAALLTFCGASDGFRVTDYDQSGNGNDKSAPTTATQPKIVAAGVLVTSNSLPTAQFDGTDDAEATGYNIAGLNSSRAVSMFVVDQIANNTQTQGGMAVLERSAQYDISSGFVFERRTTNIGLTMGSGAGGTAPTTAFQLLTTLDNNLALSVRNAICSAVTNSQLTTQIDGSGNRTLTSVAGSLATGSFQSSGTANHRLIVGNGCNNTAGTLDRPYAGRISEVVVYTTEQSANRFAISANQAAYFGVIYATVLPSAPASLGLTGYAPSITQALPSGITVIPDPIALALSGFAPAIDQTQSVQPGVDALTLTGFAPVITQSAASVVTPGAVALALTGYAPTVARTAAQSVTPSAASMVIAGFAPTLLQPRAVAPAQAALTITGLAPTISRTAGVAVAPGTALLGLTGFAPSLVQSANLGLVPGPALIGLTGLAPGIFIGSSLIADPRYLVTATARNFRASGASANWTAVASSRDFTVDAEASNYIVTADQRDFTATK